MYAEIYALFFEYVLPVIYAIVYVFVITLKDFNRKNSHLYPMFFHYSDFFMKLIGK